MASELERKEAFLKVWFDAPENIHWAHGMSNGVEKDISDTFDRAIAAWNTRPAPADLKARDRKRYKLIRKSLQNKGLLPAATDTGLVTVAENLARTIWGYFKGGPDAIAWFDNNKSLDGPTWLIEQCRSQAGDLSAAERAKYRDAMEKLVESQRETLVWQQRAINLKSDNAAKDAQLAQITYERDEVIRLLADLLATKVARIKELEQALETEKTLSRGDWACQREVDQMSIKVEALEAKLAAAEQTARAAHETLIEINPSNYNHDDVCQLNDASVEAIFLLADILGETHGKTKEWWDERRAVLGGKP